MGKLVREEDAASESLICALIALEAFGIVGSVASPSDDGWGSHEIGVSVTSEPAG